MRLVAFSLSSHFSRIHFEYVCECACAWMCVCVYAFIIVWSGLAHWSACNDTSIRLHVCACVYKWRFNDGALYRALDCAYHQHYLYLYPVRPCKYGYPPTLPPQVNQEKNSLAGKCKTWKAVSLSASRDSAYTCVFQPTLTFSTAATSLCHSLWRWIAFSL